MSTNQAVIALKEAHEAVVIALAKYEEAKRICEACEMDVREKDKVRRHAESDLVMSVTSILSPLPAGWF